HEQGTPNVNITNTTVPVHEQATAAVHEQGTADVNVTNSILTTEPQLADASSNGNDDAAPGESNYPFIPSLQGHYAINATLIVLSEMRGTGTFFIGAAAYPLDGSADGSVVLPFAEPTAVREVALYCDAQSTTRCNVHYLVAGRFTQP